MTLYMMDGTQTSNYEDNMNGEPCVVKVACTVRKGIEREGLVTVPRSQSTLHLLGRETQRFVGHEKKIIHVAFSPNGRFLVSCSEDQTVRWWEVESGQEVDCVRELFDLHE